VRSRLLRRLAQGRGPARHRFPPVVIQHAVWLYLRFTLSYRDVEELLAERGLDISYESVRNWVLKFGPIIARRLRQVRPRPSLYSDRNQVRNEPRESGSQWTRRWREADSNHRSRECGYRRLGRLICCSHEFPRCRLFRLSGAEVLRRTQVV
jgi:hypothetical protein